MKFCGRYRIRRKAEITAQKAALNSKEELQRARRFSARNGKAEAQSGGGKELKKNLEQFEAARDEALPASWTVPLQRK